jgi:toxin ParE1/3/4
VKIRFTSGARKQLRDISLYLREVSPAAAVKVGHRLREVIAMLAERSAIGVPGRVPDTREFKVPGQPYRLTYRVVQHPDLPVLEVLRIHHEAQSEAPPDWL